jgi:hypothetical protein
LSQVTIDVQARVVQRTLRDAATDMQRTMQRAGQDAGNAFGQSMAGGLERQTPRVQGALAKVTDAVSRLREEQDRLSDALRSGDFDAVVQASTRVERAHRSHASALKALQTAQSAAVEGASTLVTTISQITAPLGKIAGPAAIGGVVSGLGQLAGIAASATGALGLIPGVAVAGASAFATLKIGVQGFGEAMDNIKDPAKFAESLQQLSPAAQQTALAIQNLIPQWEQLRNTTQQSLFSGLAPQLTNVATTLGPQIQQLTTGIASSFNGMAGGLMTQLISPDTAAEIKAIVNNIVSAFQQLEPAVAPLTRAFVELANTGASFLPALAQGASQAAQAFSDWIRAAAQSGDLGAWIQQAVDTFEALWPLVENTTAAFMRLSMNKEGVAGLVSGINGLVNLLPPLIDLTTAWTGPLTTAANLLGAIENMLPSLGSSGQSAFGILTDSATNLLNPVKQVYELLKAVMEMLGGGPDLQAQAEAARDAAVGARGGPGSIGSSLTPMFGPPGTPGGSPFPLPSGAGGVGSYVGRPSGSPGGWTPTNPFSFTPPGGSGGGVGATSGPTVPYGNRDPMSLIPSGLPVSSTLYSAASSVLDDQYKVAQTEADLNKLKASNTATSDQIQAKENELAQARQHAFESQLRLDEARKSATDKTIKQLDSAAGSLSDISAGLDPDLGLSKGLPGFLDNLVRFVATLAAAPVLGDLEKMAKNSGGGYGLMGILGAQGAFGPQFTGQGQQSALGGGMPSGAAYGAPAGSPMPGESPRDFAHRVMMPFWQSQGFQVGDHGADKYGEHQNGALDIMVPSIAEGTKVLQQVLSDPNVYGAIFNNQTFGYGHGTTPQDYSAGHTGNPTQDHQDHVHALYKPGGTNNITPSSGAPMGIPSASPMPMASGFGGLPIPLPVIIVGGGGAPAVGSPFGMPAPGAPPPGSPASGFGPGPLPGPPGWTGPGIPSGMPGGGGNSPALSSNPLGPGAGASAGAGVPQPVGKAAGAGGWQPQGGGGIGVGGGAMDAAMMAAGGLDLLAPGAGQAAQTGMKLINRTIQYGGQLASIGASGLLETFGLSDSALGDPSKSWLGRAAAGVSGMAPAMPTSAGQTKAPVEPQKHEGSGAPPGPSHGVYIAGDFVQSPDRQNGQQIMNDLAFNASASKGKR